MEKFKETLSEIHLAMLCLRTMSFDQKIKALDELFSGQKYWTNILSVSTPPGIDEFDKHLHRQDQQKIHFS